MPNVDAFNLAIGRLDTTLVNSNPNKVDVGNDVDSMCGLRAYRRSTAEYEVTKENYNDASIVMYRWTPPASTATGASATETIVLSPFSVN